MYPVDEWGGQSPDGRIEIELVEHEPTRRRSRREFDPAPAPPDAPPTAAEPPVAEPPSRNRLIALVAGVGTAGLLVGWLAGSAGGDDGVGAAPTRSDAVVVTTTPTSFADDPALVEPAEPVLSAPPTTRPRPPTTTQPQVVLESLTALDPRLLGLPYEIVTMSAGGDLLYIDLASGTLTTVDRRDLGLADLLFAGDGWVAVPRGPANAIAVFHDGDPDPEILDGVDAWSIRHISGAATLWLPDDDVLNGFGGSMIEVDAHGAPTGAAVNVPSQPLALDPTGAFLVQAPGGVYAATAAGTSRVTPGTLIAYGATTALVYECDEQLTCATLTVERATGTRRDLPGLTRDRGPDALGWWSPGATPTISPDGRWAVIVAPVFVPAFNRAGDMELAGWSVSTLDLADGTSTQLDVAVDWPSGVHWAADSRFAFFVGSDGLFAYDAQTGEVVPIDSPEIAISPRATAIAVRPSDGNSWFEP
jgi:hypothetical protein